MRHAAITTEPVATQNAEILCVEEHLRSNISIQNEENNDGNNEMQLEVSKRKIIELENKIKRMEHYVHKQERIIKNRNMTVTKLKKKRLYEQRTLKKKLEKSVNTTFLNNLQRIFTNDQLSLLRTNKKKVQKWSKESILKALKIRFSCGMNGYEELRRQHFPFPGIRTLH